MKRILLVDGQIFQTDARDRGMGRYSAKLVNSVVEQGHYDEVRLILAKSGHTNHLTDRLARRLFPSTMTAYLNLSSTLKGGVEQVRIKNKKVLNRYIAESVPSNAEIDFLIPSPFQEPVVSVYPDMAKKTVVFYDLIPYLHHTRYEPLMPFENYLKRFDLLFNADLILAISQSVRDDLITYLGLLPDRIVTIDGAAIKSSVEPERPSQFDVPQKFILMPTSDDPRKNNLRAVVGFEEFRSQQQHDYKLVITSKIHQSERRRLELFSNNLVFTGNIKEEYLDWLYLHAEIILFVPESEGLGLPILEAVHANKKVVCSDLNVFKEISTTAFYHCDHEDQHAIAGAIIRAIQSDSKSIPSGEYERILNHYSWANTGGRATEAIKSAAIRVPSEKPKLAIFVPKPNGLSAVGKVIAEGHASMSEVFDIDYYAENGMHDISTRPNFLRHISNYFDTDSFGVEQYGKYDAVFYHIGNSDYHIKSIARALYLPGCVILHDTNIREAYRIMLENDMLSPDRYEAEQRLDTLLGVKNSSFLGSIINRQRALIGHSQYALDAARDYATSNEPPFIQAQLPTNVPSMGRMRNYKQPVIGLAGILANVKGVQVMEALANVEDFSNIQFRLFGYDFTGDDTVERLSAYGNVSVSTNLSDFDFQNNLSKLDIFVNYRVKYQGETSLSTLEAMRYGVVVVVRNIGWYSELPDDAVVKVEAEENIEPVLRELMSMPAKLTEISKNAKKYVRKNHSHSAYAAVMKELVTKHLQEVNDNTLISDLKSGRIKTSRDMLSALKKAQER